MKSFLIVSSLLILLILAGQPLKKAFGQDYVPVGTGRVIKVVR